MIIFKCDKCRHEMTNRTAPQPFPGLPNSHMCDDCKRQMEEQVVKWAQHPNHKLTVSLYEAPQYDRT